MILSAEEEIRGVNEVFRNKKKNLSSDKQVYLPLHTHAMRHGFGPEN